MTTIIVELTTEEAHALLAESAYSIDETDYYMSEYPHEYEPDDFESFGERKAVIDSASSKIEAALLKVTTEVPHSGEE